MKQFQKRFILLMLLMLIIATACRAQTAPSQAVDSDGSEAEEISHNLPLLPSFLEGNTNGIGEPLLGGAQDPFAMATFTLATDLPGDIDTAVVQQHNFGQLDEAKARALANQFGFTGPLYVQQIAPEFAPAEGEEAPTVFTAFSGQRILNMSNTGLTYEDRGVVVNYNERPIFAEVAPIIEAQLQAWGVLDFPYELRETPLGDLAIYRLIDGVAVEQNQFNTFFNQAGEVAYFDYHPLRQSVVLGDYPLQSAESAWQQLQSPQGRQQSRYQLLSLPTPNEPSDSFVNPRSWEAGSEVGQEIHLYMTPAVYEATDGSSLRLVYGNFTLVADEDELAEIATHLSGVLHIWGNIGETDGAKTLAVTGWEPIEMVQYETLEGTILREAGQTLLRTIDNETFILAVAPEALPDGIEIYVSATARRDNGAAHPELDWMNISEKITWPDAPVVEIPSEEARAIQAVTIDVAELIYFTFYQTSDIPLTDVSQLFIPVWKFTGETDQGQIATFWLPAVAPEYSQSSLPAVNVPEASATGSINGWVWHDLCATAMDGEPALTSAPEGCIESASSLGPYRANGSMDAPESPISELVVRLGEGACPATDLAEVTTVATDLSYSFMGLEAGTYCVSINPSEEPNLSLLRPGIWTFPEVSEETIGTTVTLEGGQDVFDINFGWDHQFLP